MSQTLNQKYPKAASCETMDINALHVFDTLHSLNISKGEFASIEDEQRHIERTGTYIGAIKKGFCIGVNHDEKHSIIIKKIIGVNKAPSRVLFRTQITIDEEIPEEVYTLHRIGRFSALENSVKHKATTMEELKDRICDRFIESKAQTLGAAYEQATEGSIAHSYIENQLRAFFWMFNEDFDSFTTEQTRPNIARIVKVFERHNRRLAIIIRQEDYEKRHQGGYNYGQTWFEKVQGRSIMVECFRPKDPEYNYVDVNREMYITNDHRDNAEIWLSDELFEQVGYHEMKVLSNKLGSKDREWILLDADTYNKSGTLLRVEAMAAQRKDEQNVAEASIQRRAVKDFSKGKLVRQGITFTKDSIESQGVLVKNEKIGEFIQKNNIHIQKEPNFGEIVRNFVCYLMKINTTYNNMDYRASYVCEFTGEENLTVGNVSINILSKNKRIYINGFGVVKDDAPSIILGALEFTDQKRFNEYLRYTSRVNLDTQKALNNKGLIFNLVIDHTDDNDLSGARSHEQVKTVMMSLPLRRENNKNITTIGGKDFKIMDMGSFLNIAKAVNEQRVGYGGGGYLQRTIKLMYKSIKGISPEDISNIIRDGSREYTELQERLAKENEVKEKKATEFLTRAIESTGAWELDEGFAVLGTSGTSYTINSNTLAVYEVVPGEEPRYVCIVDTANGGTSEWEKKDRLANRLIMLSHDIKIAGQIDTLRLPGLTAEAMEVEA